MSACVVHVCACGCAHLGAWGKACVSVGVSVRVHVLRTRACVFCARVHGCVHVCPVCAHVCVHVSVNAMDHHGQGLCLPIHPSKSGRSGKATTIAQGVSVCQSTETTIPTSSQPRAAALPPVVEDEFAQLVAQTTANSANPLTTVHALLQHALQNARVNSFDRNAAALMSRASSGERNPWQMEMTASKQAAATRRRRMMTTMMMKTTMTTRTWTKTI